MVSIRQRVAIVGAGIAWCLAALLPGAAWTDDNAARLRSLERQIDRLQVELDTLRGDESSVLVDIEELQVEATLRQSEVARTRRQITGLEEAIAERDTHLASLLAAQQETRRYLEQRLAEVYKKGDGSGIRRLLAGKHGDDFWQGVRYASWLNTRDSKTIAEFREREDEVRRERQGLEEQREELQAVRRRGERQRAAALAARARREDALQDLRLDRDRRREAVAELEAAAVRLGDLARGSSHGGAADAGTLDPEKFRGLLDWPAEGDLGAGFGTIVHPKFRTEVPHPGFDIEAVEGSEFRSVFEGRVLFASWLRSYGLTVILDHGGGLVSVYAHGSVLQVEKGQQVLRNEVLGLVGDTGSLRGPFLYFELRESGEPVDPSGWLRPRH